MPRAIVVGGGISGLTAAWRLQQRHGFDVTVLEASDHVGGKMASLRRDGFTVNRGAAVLPASYTAFRAVAESVGLGDQLEPFSATLKVPRDGRMHELRVSGAGALLDAAGTGLVSRRAKLKLRHVAADAYAVRDAMSYTDHDRCAEVDGESIGTYCARRLSQETHDWVIDPLARGLWVQDADALSSVDLFFALIKMFGPGMVRYPPGIDFLCRALADRVDVRMEARVSEVLREDGRVRVRSANGEEVVDACVLAVGGTDVPGLHPGLDPRQRELLERGIVYGDTVTAHFALSRRPPGEQLGYVLPAAIDGGLGIVPFTHVSSPQSVPTGKGLISGYWTGSWSSRHFDDDDETLLAAMLPSMRKVVPDLDDMIEFVQIERWRPATLLSQPGMYRKIAELVRLIDPADPIQLAGDYFGPPSVESAVVSVEAAVKRLAASAQASASVGA